MSKRIEMIGRQFGRLTVVALSDKRGNRGQLKYVCKCSCGQMSVVSGEDLRSNRVKSCGCLQKEIASKVNTTHGGSKERLYHIWQGMKDRCFNSNHAEYSSYGGRGISVCKEWMDYANFKSFMLSNGYDPKAPYGKCTIDRIDVNKGYCPENCRIISIQEQGFNKRNNHLITYKGKTKHLVIWAQELGVDPTIIIDRLSRGWSIEKTFETPKRTAKTYEYKGVSHTMKEWGEILGVEWWTIRNKLRCECTNMEEVIEKLGLKVEEW